MSTPFSPFVGRLKRPVLKRRQSELPSDLIDWDAPEIPEMEKQRIIYEDYIKELTEEHDVETLLNEEIFKVAHDTIVEEYTSNLKSLTEEITKEKSKVNLLLGQIKMFENNLQESDERAEELETELLAKRKVISDFEQEKENWLEERNNLKMEIEDLNFRTNEIACESNHNLELYIQKKNEAEEYKKKMEGTKNQLAHYKRLAKSKANKYDDE